MSILFRRLQIHKYTNTLQCHVPIDCAYDYWCIIFFEKKCVLKHLAVTCLSFTVYRLPFTIYHLPSKVWDIIYDTFAPIRTSVFIFWNSSKGKYRMWDVIASCLKKIIQRPSTASKTYIIDMQDGTKYYEPAAFIPKDKNTGANWGEGIIYYVSYFRW